jgi:murein DD-endopeptidase MepM/ murein hydrolase activator NlpD
VSFNQSNVWVAKRDAVWIAVVGVPLSASVGEHEITVTRGSESTVQRFNVKPKRYPEQRLTLNRDMVEPPLEVQARIERESAHLKTVRTTWSTLPQPTSAAFVIPSKGPLSSRFGQQRILNGKPRSPHAGLDVAAPAGTPIHAPGDGVVLDTGEYYYCGKTVFIDHGQGLITLYCHLSEIIAKPGDTVKQGDRIGLIGSTGRSTGPHLHWTVYLNGVAVEPELFLPSTAKKK